MTKKNPKEIVVPSARLGGESPLGGLDAQQLELLAVRAIVALFDATSCLRMQVGANPHSPYWGKEGSGGQAIGEAIAVLESMGVAGFSAFDELTYRQYYRTARPLLFPGVGRYESRLYCPECQTWCGTDDLFNAIHFPYTCPGTWKTMTIQDIHPLVPTE